jgi:hypothetical protein
MAENDFTDLSSNDRDRFAGGGRGASLRAVSAMLNALPGESYKLRQNLLCITHTAEYTGLGLDDSMQCDLN